MADPVLDALDPPDDPRSGWGLPAIGELPVEIDLDELITRIVAPNPGPMTLDGTNTYVIGEPGAGEVIVVDPGPNDPAHRERVAGVLDRRDVAVTMVLVTHHHADHAEAARPWAARFGCELAAPTREVAGPGGRVVRHGERLKVAGTTVTAVATPGHSADHTSYRTDHGPLLTGDHVIGRGTSVVAYPDGDLAAYLTSLERILELDADTFYPGHGPALDGEADPNEVVRFYLEHRRFRERQILALLEEGPQHTTRIVRRIYADVDERVLPAAAASTRAALEKLAAEGRVALEVGGKARLP